MCVCVCGVIRSQIIANINQRNEVKQKKTKKEKNLPECLD